MLGGNYTSLSVSRLLGIFDMATVKRELNPKIDFPSFEHLFRHSRTTIRSFFKLLEEQFKKKLDVL